MYSKVIFVFTPHHFTTLCFVTVVVTVTRPLPPGPPQFKKTLFGTLEPVKPTVLTLKAESEAALQDWLKLLKLAAGVVPFRESSPPVKYYNTHLRLQWVQLVSSSESKSPLHILADKNHPNRRSVGRKDDAADCTSTDDGDDDALILAAWLIEAGCPIDSRDRHGYTPLQIAIDTGHAAMAEFLQQRMSARQLHPLLPPAVDMAKGFSYIQIHFQKMYFFSAANNNHRNNRRVQ